MSFSAKQPTLEAVPEFIREIEGIRKEKQPEDWKAFVASSSEIRQWRYFLCHDPYTRWGLFKPKGYAGDGRVLDFACRHPSVNSEVTQSGKAGRAIYAQTSTSAQSRSARWRTHFIADQLNQFIEDRGTRAPKVKVAAYACGYGRELERLGLDTLRGIDCFYAVDRDAEALDEIRKHQGILQLEPLHQNVFRYQPEGDGLDFVYSMGLFDALNAKHSRFLLQRMYASLRPGGRLLIANLDIDAENVAYCEAMMDWWMILKSQSDLAELAEGVSCSEDRIHIEQLGCFNYLLIDKKAEGMCS
ncbi:class I SAM-dependent methyltransferase [Kiritimatiellota bacterium B12222]|nr:class I SAM-dependent methyltransferase [Kiritimatiellota bacterium B12222]